MIMGAPFLKTLVIHVSHYLLYLHFFCLLFCALSMGPVHGLHHHIPLGFLVVFYHRILNISVCTHVLVPTFSLVLFLEIPLASSSYDSKHALLPGICASNAAKAGPKEGTRHDTYRILSVNFTVDIDLELDLWFSC